MGLTPTDNRNAPLAIDLFCGLGGWTEGLLAEGYRVLGFDIEEHAYGDLRYPAQLVLQDVLTLEGAQFRDAALIVASPPCQEYSYMAMPWTRAKRIASALRDPHEDFPAGYTGSRSVEELNALFNACFRIQREACEAAGRHIPLIVENVRGAIPWVGRSRWAFGSFHLWGDVPALMPPVLRGVKGYPCSGEPHATKNDGGSWFAVAHNTKSGKGQNPDGRKIRGQDWNRHRLTGETTPHWRLEGLKAAGVPHIRDGAAQHGSKSSARNRASAEIAKIPLALSTHIARSFHPVKTAPNYANPMQATG